MKANNSFRINMLKKRHSFTHCNVEYSSRFQELFTNVTNIRGIDIEYEKATRSQGVINTVRVEQGEYIVLPKSSPISGIGTHHVNPCIVVCVIGETDYGLVHFDSYRDSRSLELFFKPFMHDHSIKIKILGGKEGLDPLRSGFENKIEVVDFIKKYLPNANSEIITFTSPGSLNCVFYKTGEINTDQFACGINSYKKEGLIMRLFHNIGGIITAVQSRTSFYVPLLLREAYYGVSYPFLLDYLALNALEKYDPGTLEEDLDGWATDAGGVVLAAEIRMAFYFVMNQVEEQRALMVEKLNTDISELIFCEKLISMVPVYVGLGAEDANERIVNVIKNLYYVNNSEVLVSTVRVEFNKVFRYPLMKDVLSIVSEFYNVTLTYLYANFNNLDNLSYGVDVNSEILVSILNKAIEESNPNLRVIKILKLESPMSVLIDANNLIVKLCEAYSLNVANTKEKICACYYELIRLEENKIRILNSLGSKTEQSYETLRIVIELHYRESHRRIALKKLPTIWNNSNSIEDVLTILLGQVPLNEEQSFINKYYELMGVIHEAHLQFITVKQLETISFNYHDDGVKGVIGSLVNQSIIQVMQQSPQFIKDMTHQTVTSASLTRVIRDKLPYQGDVNGLEDIFCTNDLYRRSIRI